MDESETTGRKTLRIDPEVFKNPLHDEGESQFCLYHTQKDGQMEIWAKSKKEAMSKASNRYGLHHGIFMFKYRIKHRDCGDEIVYAIAGNESDAKDKVLKEYFRQTKKKLSIDGFVVEEVHE